MIYEPIRIKCCTECHNWYPATLEFFRHYKATRSKLQSHCRECERQQSNKWKNANRDKLHEYDKTRYLENTNKERSRKQNYRNNHREEIRKYASVYAVNHREERRIRESNRRAKKAKLVSTFTKENWDRSLIWWNGACAYCGNPPRLWDNPRVLHQDHFKPIVLGGGYASNNILPACPRCNTSKNDSDPLEWIVDFFGHHKGKIVLNRIQDYFNWIEINHG